MNLFDRYVSIDYSGAKTPEWRRHAGQGFIPDRFKWERSYRKRWIYNILCLHAGSKNHKKIYTRI